MSVKKIVGTEVEYGIVVSGEEDFDPISNSILLINNYLPSDAARILWDYEQESPLSDARGFTLDEEVDAPSQEDNVTLNKVLENGARYYVDHAHPEFSTPECSNILDLLAYEKAGERTLDRSRRRAERLLKPHQKLVIYKNNSDQKGNSYGYHENYLLDRRVPFEKIARELTPFLVTRQVFCGAGKVGAENGNPACEYQISQRADFFESEIGLDTMAKRPIINTRDEPHADKNKYRRLHVITGDANMSEYTTYLKVGVTALVLSMIEEGYITKDLTLGNPVRALKDVSRDLECRRTLDLSKGRKMTPIDVQRAYLDMAVKYLEEQEGEGYFADTLRRWDYVLTQLAEDPMSLAREIDWVIKRNLIQNYCDRKGLDFQHPRVAMLDLQYHDIRKDRGLYFLLEKQGSVERVLTDAQIAHALATPPSDTRAYFRGLCQKKFGAEIFSINWDSISFSVSQEGIKRVMMMEPTKGSKTLVHDLLQQSATATDLLRNIQS